MKIEMGESLVFSWLRHVRRCRVVQTNWKGSQFWDVAEGKKESLETFINEVQETFVSQRGWDIFKGAKGVDQVLKQVECDVLGITTDVIICTECAFHEHGVQYGDKVITCAKIISKMARIGIAMDAFFPEKTVELIFSAPKMHNNLLAELPQAFQELNGMYEKHQMKCTAKLLVNDDFRSEILENVINACEQGVADGSELFVRALQLCNIFEGGKRKSENLCEISANTKEEINKEVKIGELVRTKVRDLLGSGRVDKSEILRLQTYEYSQSVFGLYFPFLSKEIIETAGLKRYYVTPVMIHGEKYYICSQWYSKQKKSLENWISQWGE